MSEALSAVITTDDIRMAWGLAPILSTWKPIAGAVHHTLLFKTATDAYALRAYRYNADDQWRIECEHALIAYAKAQGLPAIAPLPLPNSKTILEHEKRFYALFPFAPGHQVARGKLIANEVAMMGSFLGRVHHVLYNYPMSRVPQRSFVFNRAKALAKMETLERIIRSRPTLDEVDVQALAQLLHQREQLTMSDDNSLDFSRLEKQVIHGDYQEANLFFKGESISAIIDWDQSYPAPRAWEVVRTLDYALNLDTHLCHVFLEAYRTILPLPKEDLAIAATHYGLKRLHDVWVYETLYLEGNQRVRIYFQSGKPRLFTERWVNFQESL